MFDIGWTELLVVGIVALIVVGPKDLPKMFRTLGQFTAKARGMAREFQRAMDDAAESSGVNEVARDIRKATDTKGMGLDEVNKMRDWDPLKDVAKDPAKSPVPPKPEPSAEDKAATARLSAAMEKLRQERAGGAADADASSDTASRAQQSSDADKSKA